MVTRDQASATENPSFASTTGSSSTFLHFAASTNTLAESGGSNVSGITADFDGDVRQGNGGYAGAGTAPDIGADEFEGNNPAPAITGASITPSTNQCTALSRAVSCTATTPSGTITGVVINYSINGTPQTAITMTNTSGNIWDGTIPAASPANAVITWSIVATNSIPYSITYTGASYQDAPFTGVTASATATPAILCGTGSTTLNAVYGGPGIVTVGAGASTSSSNDFSPFNGTYGGDKTQFIYTAAELQAAGLGAGNITSLALDITVAGSPLSDFAISMGTTALSAFATPVDIQGGVSQVYSPSTFTPLTGINTFTLTTPYNWDGTSNIIVSFCWSNVNSSNTSSTVKYDVSASYLSQSYRQDNETAANLCALTGTVGVGTNSFTRSLGRAQVLINGNKVPSLTYSWSDGVGTVGSGISLVQTPTVTTTYTVTATEAGGCTSEATVLVTFDDLAVGGTTETNLTCNGSADGQIIVSATSTAGGLMYALNGGTPQASSTFTGMSAGSYVVVVTNINGCSKSATGSLSEPAAVVTVASNDGPVCDGATVNLDATGGYVSYAWSGSNSYSASGAMQTFAIALADAGVYTVTATDGGGCTGSSSTTVVITANTPVSVTLAATPSLSVCTGDLVTYTATPTNGGTTPLYEFFVNNVSTGAASATNTYAYNPINLDAVHVLMTSDITCTSGNPASSDTLIVSVSGAVAAGVTLTPSANSFCGAASVTFTAVPTAGGGSPTYEFFVNAGSVQNGSSDTYAYTPANGDAVYVVMTSSFACATGNPATSSTVSMVIYTIPSVPTITPSGATTFCAPGSVTLTSSYTGGNVWSTTETTDAIAVSSTGSYTVTYTDGNGCSATSAAESVTVNAASASISGLASLCTGSTNVLTASATPVATAYLWSPGLETTNTINVTAGGAYSVQTTDANGCTATDMLTVVDNAIPTASISGNPTLCTGVPETLTATASAGSGTITSYQWVLNGSTNVGTNLNTYSAPVTGSYTVIVTNSNGCSVTSAAHVLAGNGTLAGTYTIDKNQAASCTNYTSFANAFYDLNTNGISGNVVFNVAAGQTDTALLTLNMCALGANAPNALQTLAFRKSGVGANPIITAGTGVGTSDAIVKVVGVDYLTFDGIDLQANASNVDSITKSEIGYALLKCSGTDGAQNDTIKNCAITLDKTNKNVTVAIYAPNQDANFAAVTVTATSGAHSNNKFFSNTISNSYYGIYLGGMNDIVPFAYYDQNNEIGATGLGNNISNLGGAAAAVYGIYGDYQNNFNVVANTVNTGLNGGTGLINGIRLGDASRANANVEGNTVTIKTSALSTVQCIAIRSSAGSRLGAPTASSVTNVVNIKNNTIQNCTYTGSSDFWLMFLGRAAADTLTAYNLNVTGNQLINNTSSSTNATGTMFGIICQATGDSVNISNNNISGNTMNGAVGHQMRSIVTGFNSIASGSLPFAPKYNVSGNTIEGNISTATTGAVQGIAVELYGGASPQLGTTVDVNNNKVGNVTLTSVATAAYTGISSSTWANAIHTMSGNKVYNVSRNAATTGAFTGITLTSSSAPVSITMDGDTVSGISMTAASTAVFTGITSTSSPLTAPSFIRNNRVMNNTIAGTGIWYGLYQTGSPDTLTMSGNVVSGNTKSTTGTMYCMYFSTPAKLSFTGNSVTNNVITGGAATCTMYGMYGSTSKYLSNGNTIENNGVNNMTGTSTATIYCVYNVGSPTEETISNNIIRNIFVKGTTTGSNTIRGMYHSTVSTAGSFRKYLNNSIDSLYTPVGVSANIAGIYSTTGNDVTMSKNKIFGLFPGQSTGTSSAKAIVITSGTNVNAYNNLIQINASTPVLTANTAVAGIEITSGTAMNIRYNTIRLTGNGSGTAFGSSGISITSTTPTVALNNNLVLNLTGAGGGTAAASAVGLRRSTSALTGYSSASNRNLWYAGTASGSHLLYFDGTNSDQTLLAMKGHLAPSEANSKTENVALLSTVGANALFLHVDSTIATQAESGAGAITGIDDDFDGQIRQGSIGYAGTGTAPDIGADEFGGISSAPLISNVVLSPSSQCVAVSHTVSADVTTAVGVIDSVTFDYSLNGTAQTTQVLLVPTSGNTYTFTIPTAIPTSAVVTWTVRGYNSVPLSSTYVGTSYQDDYLSSVSISASANPTGALCEGTSTDLTAVVSQPKSVQVGTGTAVTSTYPFYRLYGSSKTQMMYTATELSALGLTAGNITAVGFNVTTASTNMPNYSVSMKNSGASTLTAFETGLTTVYSTVDFIPVAGVNMHTITPFNWNGTSNLIVEVCFQNLDAGGSSSSVAYSNPGFAAVFKQYQDNSDTHCSGPAGTTSPSSTIRPNLYINGNGAPSGFTTSWTDGTNTIGTGTPLTITPTSTLSYTATATDANGCSLTAAPVEVQVLPIPAAPAGTDSTQCGNGAPFCYVQGTSGAVFNWYDAAVGGTLLQSSISTTYTTSINATTTFYVSEVGTNGCPGLRVAVTETVTIPDAIDAQASDTTICPGTSIDLSVTQTGSFNTYNYTWNALPSSGSGIAGTINGNPVSAIPTIPGTYNYIVTAVDLPNNCVIQDSVYVLVYNVPTITSVDANPDTVCAGYPVVLTALTPSQALGVAKVGTAITTTTTNAVLVLPNFYEGTKLQYLVRASSLTAAGLYPGDITSLGFKLTAIGSLTFPWQGYTIKLAHVTDTALTTTFLTPSFTTVYGPLTQPVPIVGVNTLTFSTPFNWNGTSNILVDICYDNDPTGTCTSCYNGSGTQTAEYTVTSFNSVHYYQADGVSQAARDICGAPAGVGSVSTTRPNLYFGGTVNGYGSGTYSWIWSPGSISGNQITANPLVNTNYTVTATDGATTCTNSATVNVVVNPTPPAPVATNGSHCGLQTPICFVTPSQGGTSFSWYTDSVGGSALAGQSGASLVSYPRAQTDTFYVSETYPTGPCEGPRSMVIENYTAADAITATATVPNDTICPFGTVTLSATQGTTNTYTSYTWTTIPAGGTASGQNTTAAAPNLPGQLIWLVSASDGTCITTTQDTITIAAPPIIYSVTKSTDSICPGTSVTLTALTPIFVNDTIRIGTGTTGTTTTYSPFYRSVEGHKGQYLFKASELTALGLAAGNITEVSLRVMAAVVSPDNLNGFTIRMAQTSDAVVTTTWVTSGLSTVYGPVNYSPTFGVNTFPVTAFTWNGTSNIIIQTCFDNDPNNTCTTCTGNIPSVQYTSASGFVSSHYWYASNTAQSNRSMCDTLYTGFTSSSRPNWGFRGQKGTYAPGTVNWTWNPGSLSGNSVVVTPLVTTTYTVTATDPNPPSCYNEQTITILVHPEPLAPINPHDTVQCGSGVPLISVTRSGPATDTFRWYTVASGGTPLPGESDSVLTAEILSATTTYYVAEYNGYCE